MTEKSGSLSPMGDSEDVSTVVDKDQESESGSVSTIVDKDQEPEMFDRAYVERLREESAGYRVKAKPVDELRTRLVTAYAAATGRLADATDLPYDAELLDDDGLVDEPKVRAAVNALLVRKPHLASRRPTGSVDQGVREDEAGVSLVGLLRGA